MKSKWIIYGWILFSIPQTSCDHPNEPKDCNGDNVEYIDTYYQDELGEIECVLQNIDDTKTKVNIVIKSQDDYENYFACNDPLPEIDFDKYFILAGRYTHKNCAVFDNQKVIICENALVYNVSMREQICQAITDVFYVAVVEIKYGSLPVEFNVHF